MYCGDDCVCWWLVGYDFGGDGCDGVFDGEFCEGVWFVVFVCGDFVYGWVVDCGGSVEVGEFDEVCVVVGGGGFC